MASFKIEWRRSAEREFHKLPTKVKAFLIHKILDLSENPRPTGSKKLEGSINSFRIRQGDFRVVYQVEEAILIILIVRVAHRKEVYR